MIVACCSDTILWNVTGHLVCEDDFDHLKHDKKK